MCVCVPLVQVLEERQNACIAGIVEEVFRRVGQGIMRNDLFTAPAMLVFVHGLMKENIPQLATSLGECVVLRYV